MTTHPQSPFTLVTSHLDNSVIFWDLMGLKDLALAQLKFVLDMNLLETVCDPHDLMLPGVRGKLAGEVSRGMQTGPRKLKRHERVQQVLRFFNR